MTMSTIVGIGEFIWDLFPEGREAGGAVANVVQHARTMGENAILVSRVGNDTLGKDFFALWKTRGLDASYVSIDDDHPTGTVTITRHANGDASYKPIPNIASDYIPFTPELETLAHSADGVCFGTFGQQHETSRQSIRSFLKATKPHCLRMYDINIRPNRSSPAVIISSLELATVLKLNDEELSIVASMLQLSGDTRSQMRDLMEKFDLQLIALTRGAHGALLLEAGGTANDHPGFAVKTVDTVGAGDAFTAALLVGLLRHMPLAHLNEFANRVGSYVCTQTGATPPLPPEILALLP